MEEAAGLGLQPVLRLLWAQFFLHLLQVLKEGLRERAAFLRVSWIWAIHFVWLLNGSLCRSSLDFCRVTHVNISLPWIVLFYLGTKIVPDVSRDEAGPKGLVQNILQTTKLCACLCICEKQINLTSHLRLLCQLRSDNMGIFGCLVPPWLVLSAVASVWKQWVGFCVVKAICTTGLKNDWNKASFNTLMLKDCWCSSKSEHNLGFMFSFSSQETVSRLRLSWVVLPASGRSLNSGSAEAFRGAALVWSLVSVSKGSKKI